MVDESCSCLHSAHCQLQLCRVSVTRRDGVACLMIKRVESGSGQLVCKKRKPPWPALSAKSPFQAKLELLAHTTAKARAGGAHALIGLSSSASSRDHLDTMTLTVPTGCCNICFDVVVILMVVSCVWVLVHEFVV